MFARFSIPSDAYTANTFILQVGKFQIPISNIIKLMRIVFNEMQL